MPRCRLLFRLLPPQVIAARKVTLEPHVEHDEQVDRKSTRLNSSHLVISYAVFCLKKQSYLGTSGLTSSSRSDRQPLRLLPLEHHVRARRAVILGHSCAYFGNRIFFFFNDTATTEIYTLSLHDALPI